MSVETAVLFQCMVYRFLRLDKWIRPVSYTHLDVYKRQAQTLKASVEGARQVSHKMDKISETSVQQADAITQIRKSEMCIRDRPCRTGQAVFLTL